MEGIMDHSNYTLDACECVHACVHVCPCPSKARVRLCGKRLQEEGSSIACMLQDARTRICADAMHEAASRVRATLRQMDAKVGGGGGGDGEQDRNQSRASQTVEGKHRRQQQRKQCIPVGDFHTPPLPLCWLGRAPGRRCGRSPGSKERNKKLRSGGLSTRCKKYKNKSRIVRFARCLIHIAR